MKLKLAAVAAVLAASPVQATDVVFTVWDDFDFFCCRYAVQVGNVMIGRNPAQFVQGFAEFDYAARSGTQATLSFEVGSIFANWMRGSPPDPSLGSVWDVAVLRLSSYSGDGFALGLDAAAPTTGLIGDFPTGDFREGSRLSFDVSDQWNAGSARGDTAFGVRFTGPFRNGESYDSMVFRDVELAVTAVPEPETYALFLLGIAAMVARSRRQKSAQPRS